MNTDTAADREALDSWRVREVDQPIGIAPFPCGRYVGPNHGADDAALAATCAPLVTVAAIR